MLIPSYRTEAGSPFSRVSSESCAARISSRMLSSMGRPLMDTDPWRCACYSSYNVYVCPVSESEMAEEKNEGRITERTVNAIRRGRRTQTAFLLKSFLNSNPVSVQKLYMM